MDQVASKIIHSRCRTKISNSSSLSSQQDGNTKPGPMRGKNTADRTSGGVTCSLKHFYTGRETWTSSVRLTTSMPLGCRKMSKHNPGPNNPSRKSLDSLFKYIDSKSVRETGEAFFTGMGVGGTHGIEVLEIREVFDEEDLPTFADSAT